jgi:hypothetical protein
VGLGARLPKSESNRVEALRHCHRESRSEFDLTRLGDAAGGHVMPGFHRALLAKQEAEGLAKRGETRRASGKWKEAAALFVTTARENEKRRALAYHLAGECRYEAMKATLALAAKEPALVAEAKALGHAAHRAFEAFGREAEAAAGERTQRDAAKLEDRRRSAEEAMREIEKAFGAPPDG